MKISVQIKTNSKIESVEQTADGIYVVRVHTPPIEGRANKRACELLADYFNLSKSSVILVSGQKSRKKIFEVNGL